MVQTIVEFSAIEGRQMLSTKYAKSGDLHIAYQVFGDGPIDVVYVPTWISNVEILAEEPTVRAFFERVGEFARVIAFDRRGSGLSDQIDGCATLEDQMDDVLAVMDAAGSERAAMFAQAEGGAMAAMFAATHPERTTALVLFAAFARLLWDEDYTWANTAEQRAPIVEHILATWGEEDADLGSRMVPSRAHDPKFRRWFSRMQRFSMSPGTARKIMYAIGDTDVRDILPSITVPTLVMRRTGDQFAAREHSLYFAEHIPCARFVELPGEDLLAPAGDTDAVVDEIEEFLTGERAERAPDRVLATVLFTDIVGSTERAAEMGDASWRQLLARHDELVRAQISRHRGRAVKSTGDGVLATFDGPARAIHGARAIASEVGDLGIETRAGLHTGECEMIGDDVGGLAVHIGARVMSKAAPGEVLVSSTVKDLVAGSGIDFADRGEHDLKGVPGPWRLFSVG